MNRWVGEILMYFCGIFVISVLINVVVGTFGPGARDAVTAISLALTMPVVMLAALLVLLFVLREIVHMTLAAALGYEAAPALFLRELYLPFFDECLQRIGVRRGPWGLRR